MESGVYTHYRDTPPKPININWRQYVKLLRCSYIYPVTYLIDQDNYNTKEIGWVFIIPTITTFSFLIQQINNLLSKNQI